MPVFQRHFKLCATVALLLPIGNIFLAGCSQSNASHPDTADPGAAIPPASIERGTNGSASASGHPKAMSGRGKVLAAGATGSEIFQQKCVVCHGMNGSGGFGPRLTDLSDLSDAQLHTIVHNGKGQMPALAGQLSDAQISAVIAHVRTLGGGKSLS